MIEVGYEFENLFDIPAMYLAYIWIGWMDELRLDELEKNGLTFQALYWPNSNLHKT